MKGIFGDLFDLDGDGEMSAAEQALELMALSDMLAEDDSNDDTDAGDWDY